MIVSSGKVTERTCLWQDKNYLPKWERTAEKKKNKNKKRWEGQVQTNSKNLYFHCVRSQHLGLQEITHWSVFLKSNYSGYQSISLRNLYYNVCHIYIKYSCKYQSLPANIPCS